MNMQAVNFSEAGWTNQLPGQPALTRLTKHTHNTHTLSGNADTLEVFIKTSGVASVTNLTRTRKIQEERRRRSRRLCSSISAGSDPPEDLSLEVRLWLFVTIRGIFFPPLLPAAALLFDIPIRSCHPGLIGAAAAEDSERPRPKYLMASSERTNSEDAPELIIACAACDTDRKTRKIINEAVQDVEFVVWRPTVSAHFTFTCC